MGYCTRNSSLFLLAKCEFSGQFVPCTLLSSVSCLSILDGGSIPIASFLFSLLSHQGSSSILLKKESEGECIWGWMEWRAFQSEAKYV